MYAFTARASLDIIRRRSTNQNTFTIDFTVVVIPLNPAKILIMNVNRLIKRVDADIKSKRVLNSPSDL